MPRPVYGGESGKLVERMYLMKMYFHCGEKVRLKELLQAKLLQQTLRKMGNYL